MPAQDPDPEPATNSSRAQRLSERLHTPLLERSAIPKRLRSERIASAAKGGVPVPARAPEEFGRAGLIASATIIVGAIALALHWLARAEGRVPAEKPSAVVAIASRPSFGERFAQFEHDAQGAAAKFLAVDDWRKVEEQIHGGGGLSEVLAKFQRRRPKQSASVRRFGALKARFGVNDEVIYMLEVEDEGFHTHRLYFADSDPPRVLWEVYVAYCDVPFDSFAAGSSDQAGLLRVFAEDDDFRPLEFEDADRWRCMRLVHPVADGVVFAFVDRQSEAGAALDLAMAEGGKRAAVILKLRGVPGTPLRCAVVEEFGGLGWHHRMVAN